MSIDGDELLGYLRNGTRAHHSRIEQVMGLDGDFSLRRYVQALQSFEAFLSAWEAPVASLLGEEDQAWFLGRSRVESARADLKALGAVSRRDLRPRFDVQDRSSAFAWGAMYVIEGSALGGQVIAERVRVRHRVDHGSGAAFFGGRQERTGPMWRDFRIKLAQRVTRSEANYAEALAGATATFDGLAVLASALA